MAYSLPYQSLLILNLHSFCFSLSLRHSFTLQGPSTSHIIHISYKYKQSIPRIQRVEARPATGAMEALLSAARAKNKIQRRWRVEALPRWFLFGRFLRPANLPTSIFLKKDYKCCNCCNPHWRVVCLGVGRRAGRKAWIRCLPHFPCLPVAHCRTLSRRSLQKDIGSGRSVIESSASARSQTSNKQKERVLIKFLEF